jgi:hypothetical protein
MAGQFDFHSLRASERKLIKHFVEKKGKEKFVERNALS